MFKECKKCGNKTLKKTIINGIVENTSRRIYCLDCVPWKSNKIYEVRREVNSLKYFTKTDLQKAITGSNSIRECLKKLGYTTSGTYFEVFKEKIKKYNLDISHFCGQSWARGKNFKSTTKIPLEEILIENSSYKTNTLRIRLIKEGIFEKKCYGCNLIEWMGKEIPLQLEHKNGIPNDHRIENLTILCPNCHALTDTYCGKNIKIKYNYKKQGRIFKKYFSKNKKCKLCEKLIKNENTFCSHYCSNNYNKNKIPRKRKVENRPSKEELQEMLKESNFCELGRKFGVSDNAIRKWLK